MNVRLGIIGFGRIGNLHAQWMREARGIEVAGVHDPTDARRELARSSGLPTFQSIDELLDEGAIDAVLVSTPTSMHFEHASRALGAGKHVMIEKPMALNRREAERVASDAAKSGRVVSVFQNRRYDVDYLALKAAIDRGTLGRVFNVESRLGQWDSCVGPAATEWRPNWRNESAFGGGGLFDWGSHFLDQMWRMMLPAKPQAVFAQLRGNVWSADCDDFARVLLNFDNGATGIVEINTTTTRPLPRWHVDGTLGSADSPFSLSFDTNEWAKLTFAPADGSSPITLPLVEHVIPSKARNLQVSGNQVDGDSSRRTARNDVTGGDSLAVWMWEQFAAACRGEGEPAVTARSVLPTMALLDAARESSKSGRAIAIDADVQFLPG